ncbi:hypothetical protein D3C80_1371670 [compost metagenome]
MHVVAGLGPVHVEYAILEHAALLNGVKTDLFLDGPGRQLPDFFRSGTVFGIGHHQVGGQAVREGPDFTGGAAGGRLAGEGEGAVARFADLAGKQVNVVDQVVGPDATGMLVETHGPERYDLAFRVGIKLGQGLEAFRWHA